MSYTPIPADVLRNAEAACADGRKRFATGDRTITAAEGDAYLALLRAAKECGTDDPFAETVALASPPSGRSWRYRRSPLAHRWVA